MKQRFYFPNKGRPYWMLEKVTDPTEITLIHLGKLYCNPGCGHHATKHDGVYGKFTCTFYFKSAWNEHRPLTGLWRYKRYKGKRK